MGLTNDSSIYNMRITELSFFSTGYRLVAYRYYALTCIFVWQDFPAQYIVHFYVFEPIYLYPVIESV